MRNRFHLRKIFQEQGFSNSGSFSFISIVLIQLIVAAWIFAAPDGNRIGTVILMLSSGLLLGVFYQRLASIDKKCDQCHQKQKEELSHLMQRAPVGIFRTDASGECVYVNEHWTKISGITASEAVGSGWTNAIHPEDYELVFQEWKAAVENRRPFELVYRFITPSQGIKWVHGRSVALMNEANEVVGFFGAIQDISQTKAVEEELFKQHSRIRALYELASGTNLSVEQHLQRALELGCEWFEMEQGLLSMERGEGFFAEVYFPENCGLIHEERVNLTDPRWVTSVSSTLALGTGTRFSLNFFSSRERSISFTRSDEDIIQLLARWMEALLNRRQAERLIHEQQVMMVSSSKMTALGEMAGGIAHEINNPLAIISGNAEVLGRLVAEPKMDVVQLTRIAEKIKGTCGRIARIVQGLRSFAREDEQIPLHSVSVKQLIEDTLSFCQEKFLNEKIQICVAPIDESLMVSCRASHINQVILNLLNNARDAVEELPEKWIAIECKDIGESVEVRVIDSGWGIPKDLRDRILEPFFTTKAIGKGTGLGLSISKGLVESHGGTLCLDEGNSNTCFVVTLPKNLKKDHSSVPALRAA